jgi:hypothetical protein
VSKYIALDTAQIGDWCRDRVSPKKDLQDAVMEFESAFLGGGHVLVLTLHHIIELLRATPDVALKRVEFLALLPKVAWPRSRMKDGHIGNVLDIMAAEVIAALTCINAVEVCKQVRPSVFIAGSGRDLIGANPSDWLMLRPEALAQADSDRRNVAITRSQTIKAPKLTVAELKASKFRSPEEAVKIFPSLMQALAIDIRDRGDRRLEKPTLVAADFYAEVINHAAALEGGVEEAIRKDFAAKDVELDELGPNAYLADLLDLVVFRKQLRVISKWADLTWEQVKSLATIDKLPSAMIERGLRLYGQDQKERKGSEINDRYLATLACYADLTYLDKRTLNDFREVKRRYPVLKELLQQTEKNSNWRTATNQIVGLASG